ncbi:CHAT domain-containing protein [Actinomadura pelletieri DSM 43383]|uniref:CHAT domain-containing protein n=1 Tax=Actinomadura pelletieri DSM 43383 TaxID=1120940 RepID=A0A495QUG7_9ACTN|nr:CHAT domain-containing protein [Actinomadura pelletieri]RKS77164.1 CHAT domain-containing protein [Actinomadura pelletieri DSM 43383]
MDDEFRPDIDELRRRAAEVGGRERVPALIDLGRALGRLAVATEDEAVRHRLWDEAVETLTEARESLPPEDERRAKVTLRLIAGLVGRAAPLDDPHELDRVIELLREVTPAGVLETEKGEAARLLLGLLLIKRLLDRHLAKGPLALVKLVTGHFEDYEKGIDLLGRIEESLLPTEIRPLPSPLRMMLMASRMLLQGRTGALTTVDFRTMIKQLRAAFGDVTGKGSLGQIASVVRGVAAGLEMRLQPNAAIAGEVVRELEPLKDLSLKRGDGFLVQELAFAYAIGDETFSLEGLKRARETLAEAIESLDEDDPRREEILLSMVGLQYVGVALDPTPEAVQEMLLTARDLELPAGPPVDTGDAWKLTILSSIRSLQGMLDNDDAVLAEAWRRLEEALPFAAHDAALAALILPVLGANLIRRATGGLADQHLSHDLMLRGMEIHALPTGGADETSPLLLGVRGLLFLLNGDDVDEASHWENSDRLLTAALEALPESSAVRPILVAGLASARMLRGIKANEGAYVRSAVDLLEGFHANERAAGPYANYCAVLAALGRLYLGVLERDTTLFDGALRSLESAADLLQSPYDDRETLLRAIGYSHLLRGQLFNGGRDALDEAIRVLEDARALAARRPRWLQGPALPAYLADAYAAAGDLRRAVNAGMEALWSFAAEVLLQVSPDHALFAARGAAELARRTAGWCLEDGRLKAAVRALEMGRGLVLYAATISADVPELLLDRGRPDLADEWRSVAGNTAGPAFSDLLALNADPREATGSEFRLVSAQALRDLLEGLSRRRVPSDLRHRVLLELTLSPGAEPLFEPPEADDIGDALDEASMDALIYLLHGDETAPGRALIVWANGRVDILALPGLVLDATPLKKYRPRQASPESLESLCDWAWNVAMNPLLKLFTPLAPENVPRVVLVPCGALGLVPWHAAATDRDGRRRYAVHDLVISYAATGRQFMDVAWRPSAVPVSAPTFVANPCPKEHPLKYAELEVRAIVDAFYPTSDVLGELEDRTTGQGDVESVLNALPHSGNSGAPVLHLACHAMARHSPTQSALYLHAADGNGRLRVGGIIERANRHPENARGGLVVLSACGSDLTVRDHDEALTPATAFLVAGSGGVIGSRWAVNDASTAVMMFMFHHFLVDGGLRPMDALRSAQLWMLDSARSVPGTMPRDMTELLETMSEASLTATFTWGAFTHHGL